MFQWQKPIYFRYIENPNKGQSLYNAIHINIQDLYKHVPNTEGRGETEYKIKYLEHYWPELATNPVFVKEFTSSMKINNILSVLLENQEIEEKDVIAYALEIHILESIRLMIKLFPLPVCVTLYLRIDKKLLLDNILDMYEEDVEVVTAIITMADDFDVFYRLLRQVKNTMNFIKLNKLKNGYFRGVARNRNALNWISEELFTQFSVPLEYLCNAAAVDPDVIIISREVFDIFRGDTDPETYALNFLDWLMRNINRENVRLACYEVLFRTDYFPFSFFTEVLPRTKELEKWILLSTDI